MEQQTEFVTYRQWESMAKRIERKNLKQVGRSLTFTGIERRAHSYIIEMQDDHAGMIVKTGWREAMRDETRHGLC